MAMAACLHSSSSQGRKKVGAGVTAILGVFVLCQRLGHAALGGRQAMPVGAGFELLKKINFFEAADQSAQWWVLVAWILVGLTLSIRLFFKKS